MFTVCRLPLCRRKIHARPAAHVRRTAASHSAAAKSTAGRRACLPSATSHSAATKSTRGRRGSGGRAAAGLTARRRPGIIIVGGMAIRPWMAIRPCSEPLHARANGKGGEGMPPTDVNEHRSCFRWIPASALSAWRWWRAVSSYARHGGRCTTSGTATTACILYATARPGTSRATGRFPSKRAFCTCSRPNRSGTPSTTIPKSRCKCSGATLR